MGPNNNKPTLGQTMAWHWTGNKTFSELMMAYFANAYMYHSASMIYQPSNIDPHVII